MTAIIGVFCKDGVVVGTDSSSTFAAGQIRTIEQTTDKIHIIDGRIILAGTGPVGYTQRVNAVVEKVWANKGFKGSGLEVAKRISKESIEDFNSTYGCRNPLNYGSLLAYPVENNHHLCEFDVNNFQPEMKTDRIWYCSMGSGQLITDPFLGFIREVFWQTGRPAVPDGVFAVTWSLEHVITLNPAGVNGPINIAVLEKAQDGKLHARVLDESELGQHRQSVQAAKERLRGYKADLLPGPETPTPPTR